MKELKGYLHLMQNCRLTALYLDSRVSKTAAVFVLYLKALVVEVIVVVGVVKGNYASCLHSVATSCQPVSLNIHADY